PGGLLAGKLGEDGNDARGMMTMACHREFPSPIKTRGWGLPIAVCLAAPEAPRPPQAIATPEAPQPSPAIAVQVRWKPAAAAYLTTQGRGKCSRRHTGDLSSTRAQLLPRPSPHALPDRTAAHAGIDTIAAVPALATHVGTATVAEHTEAVAGRRLNTTELGEGMGLGPYPFTQGYNSKLNPFSVSICIFLTQSHGCHLTGVKSEGKRRVRFQKEGAKMQTLKSRGKTAVDIQNEGMDAIAP
uniref:Uncharacterized protein n=1 Tax=Oryza glaberrima TaxID=4538 RepID=I1R642_ORYGL